MKDQKSQSNDDRVISVTCVGKKFTVTTKSKKFKTTMVEEKNPNEFITWFGSFSKELDEKRKQRIDFEKRLAGMSDKTEEIEKRCEIIKQDLDKCEDLESLKNHLVKVFSGLLNHEESMNSAKANLDYLKERENHLQKLMDKNRQFHVKALRMCKKKEVESDDRVEAGGEQGTV